MFMGTRKGGLFFSPGAGVRPVRRWGVSRDFSPFIFGNNTDVFPHIRPAGIIFFLLSFFSKGLNVK